MTDISFEKMTDEELAHEIEDCKRWIEFWEVDLRSKDEDYVAEARMFIWKITRWLDAVQEEMRRREEVIR